MKIKYDTNLLDYSTWTEGDTGSDDPYFGAYGTDAQNFRKTATDPFGNDAVVWSNSGTTTSNLGGWNGSLVANKGRVSVDETKDYRLSVWIKREVKSTAGSFYFGLITAETEATTSLNGVVNIQTSKTSTNAYLLTKSYSDLEAIASEGDWMLVVGYIHNKNYTGTTISTDAGMYNSGGTKVTNGEYEYKFLTGTNYLISRILAPLSGDIDARMLNCYPRIDCIDGTEPSLDTLLAQEGSIRDVEETKIKYDTNLFDYSDWVAGTSGSTSDFPQYTVNDGINYRDIGDGPHGNDTTLWKTSVGTLTNWRGGTKSDYKVRPDLLNMVRQSVWVRRTNVGTSNLFYFGWQTQGDNCKWIRDNETSGLTAYNYYYSGNYNAIAPVFPENEWRLLVGYHFPYTYTGTTFDEDYNGVVYDLTGGTVTTYVYNFIFLETTTTIRMRLYCPYNGDTEVKYDFCYPRMDIMDGTEPSLETLLKQEGSWRDVIAIKVNSGDTWEDIYNN